MFILLYKFTLPSVRVYAQQFFMTSLSLTSLSLTSLLKKKAIKIILPLVLVQYVSKPFTDFEYHF